MGIIYKSTNEITGKVYIGKSINSLEERITQHKHASGRNNQYFQRSIKKYGIENFKWEVIDNTENEKKLNELEKYWIEKYNSFGENGYNLTVGGEGVGSGKYHPRWVVKVEKECLNCGITFKRTEVNITKFCSKKCEGEYRTKKFTVERVCLTCGKKFIIQKCIVERNGGKYCSRLCYIKSNSFAKIAKGIDSRKKNSFKKSGRGLFGFTGVTPAKRKKEYKWVSYITFNTKRTYLGLFTEPLSGEIIYKFVQGEIYGSL